MSAAVLNQIQVQVEEGEGLFTQFGILEHYRVNTKGIRAKRAKANKSTLSFLHFVRSLFTRSYYIHTQFHYCGEIITPRETTLR